MKTLSSCKSNLSPSQGIDNYEIKDIFKGKFTEIWTNEESVFLHFLNHGITIAFDKKEWKEIMIEMTIFLQEKTK